MPTKQSKQSKQQQASRKPASRPKAAASTKASLSATPLKDKLKRDCNNDTDPVLLEDFADMSERELKQVVRIGPGAKKNCYALDSIYNVIKAAAEKRVAPRDPMNPSHLLTEAELATIHGLMKANDRKYKPPGATKTRDPNAGLELHIEVNPFYPTYYDIRIKRGARTVHDLGTVPGWVEVHHTGSTDYTSAVLLANVRELWDNRRLIAEATSDPNFLRRTVREHWRQHNWLGNFITVCECLSVSLR